MNNLQRSLLALVFLSALPLAAHAATLSVVPSASSMTTGDIVTVRIVANTAGTAVNEAEATLQFPTDMFDVISVDKSSSFFTLWVEDPTYSNSAGTVTFDGGIPNPGYTGIGTVLTVTLHAKQAGAATLSLTDAAVHANDGLGTDVLTNASGAQILIAGPTAQPTPTPATPASAPPSESSVAAADSVITNLVSPTHPDQSLWYANANPQLTWTLPAGALAVETIIGENTTVTPSVLYQPAISTKTLSDLLDGITYFNIRAKTKNGWGPVASYRLQIDTVPPTIGNPTFSYDLVRRQLVITNISVADTGSGVAKLALTIDGGTPILILPSEISNDTYRYTYRTAGSANLLSAPTNVGTPSTDGTHTAVLSVYDEAGNRADATGAFVVPITLIDQTLFSFFGISVTFLWFVIAVLLLSLASFIAAGAAWSRLFQTRQSTRTKVAKREQVVHRSLSFFKNDLERHIRSLENVSGSRELTVEEEKLRTDLTENLVNLERYIKKEFKKFD